MRQRTRHFFHECLRTRWMLVLPLVVVCARGVGWLPDASPLTVLLYKPSLAAVGFLVAHIGYQQAFPYLSQQALLERALMAGDITLRYHAALLFVGTAILRGLIYVGVVLGVTLGL